MYLVAHSLRVLRFYHLSQLQQLIDTTSSPSSPFHLSHASSSTDATVYPPPGSSDASQEPDAKKRKRATDDKGVAVSHADDTHHARFPNLMLSNKHLVQVHSKVKEECEHLAELCVGESINVDSRSLDALSTGQSQTLDQPDHAKVRFDIFLAPITMLIFNRIEEYVPLRSPCFLAFQ